MTSAKRDRADSISVVVSRSIKRDRADSIGVVSRSIKRDRADSIGVVSRSIKRDRADSIGVVVSRSIKRDRADSIGVVVSRSIIKATEDRRWLHKLWKARDRSTQKSSVQVYHPNESHWLRGPAENELLWPELARQPKKCKRPSKHIANVEACISTDYMELLLTILIIPVWPTCRTPVIGGSIV